MRILKIRFKNLNSLMGEWEIDLAHPAYSRDGIFAITGATGAGKSTILDAICLALYGRTPRLSRISKTENEIMSRQTGECFAEVTFETQKGRYCCHWSQHRSRKNPNAELQNPKHEISNALTGAVLETKIRAVAGEIETLTGMDFDRLTRSMLLAQGGFAAFLQAQPDDRAPILEQITGTKIYSDISKHVHERTSIERKKLDILQGEINAVALLSEEEEEILNENFAQKTLNDAELSRQIAQHTMALTWIEGIERLKTELGHIATLKEELHTRTTLFAPEQEKLNKATLALELSADHSSLISIRKSQETESQDLAALQKEYPSFEANKQTADDALKRASDEWAKTQNAQKTAAPLLRKVRDLDLQITEKERPIKEVVESLKTLKTTIDAQRKTHTELCNDLIQKNESLKAIREQLDTSKADEGLVEHLAGIREKLSGLKALGAQFTKKRDELNLAKKEALNIAQILQKQTESSHKTKLALTACQERFKVKQSELMTVLGNIELSDWRASLASLTQQHILLSKAKEASKALSLSKQKSDQLSTQHQTLQQTTGSISEQLLIKSDTIKTLEREREYLETQLALLKKIEGLETLRHQLEDGVPCPLCGAPDHPFAQGNIATPDETQQSLLSLRTQLSAQQDALSALQVQQAELRKDLERNVAAQQEQSETIKTSQDVIVESCRELHLESDHADFSAYLDKLLQENEEKRAHAVHVVTSAEVMETELNKRRTAQENAQSDSLLAERETQTCAHKNEQSEQLLKRLTLEVDSFKAQQEKALQDLNKDISVYGVSDLSIDRLDHIQDQFVMRRDLWLSRQNEARELEKTISNLDTQARHTTEQIKKAEGEIITNQQKHEKLLKERNDLITSRHSLFADKQTDLEEQRLALATDAALSKLEECKGTLNACVQALSNQRTKIEGLEKSIAQRTQQLRSSESAFLQRLSERGFQDEAGFLAACLSEEARKDLTQRAKLLSDENIKLTSQFTEKTTLLETEIEKKITQQPRNDLIVARASLLESQKELQQDLGAIRQKILANTDLKQQYQTYVEKIEAQKKETSRWDLLHELIGSADGKKFRNFAQGLTFEVVIGHANQQLQKMSDRYLLTRDVAHPLELNVIDNYQAGEVRSTKNLSGGESFIVSLSLALGLSHMASKNVRVDSLFLDEGFGTLDEEALDIALETLSNLQQDGKLIGIISHVPTLKERISTQIQVSKGNGGKSYISGPGCTHA